MIKIENVDVFGWEAAIRGMRNPLESWGKIDTVYYSRCTTFNPRCGYDFDIGENDLKLMQNLSKAGTDHAKFLRMINVTCDITAPLYWWKEYDTYKVGTVANSCSTMHKIHAKEFTLDDFSHEHLDVLSAAILNDIISNLNDCRKYYLNGIDDEPAKDKKWWWQMIQLLPSSYNQKRTVQLNYQVLKSMYFARRNHRLDEWQLFCTWMEELPYFQEICNQE